MRPAVCPGPPISSPALAGRGACSREDSDTRQRSARVCSVLRSAKEALIRIQGLDLLSGVSGLGSRFEVPGSRVEGVGSGVQGLQLRSTRSRSRVQGPGSRAWGVGLRRRT
eukprot:3168137-Rhodomonas_salina.1